MQQDPASASSDTYELKIAMSENTKPEEFLKIMKNFKIAVHGTGSTIVSGKTNDLRTILSGEFLQEFDGM